MSEKVSVKDVVLGELAMSIEAQLPIELVRFLFFSQDKKAENLVIDWSIQLPSGDLKLLTDVVAQYGGCYVNVKGVDKKDCGCFHVPKVKPSLANQSVAASVKPSVESKKEEKPVAFVKPESLKPLLQPSPISMYRDKYCSTCGDQGLCRPDKDTARMMLCARILQLQFLDSVAEKLHNLCKILEVKVVTTSKPAVPSPQPVQQPAGQTVQRNTRPTQGHIDLGIVWTYETGGRGQYEKATEADNKNREDYFKLEDWIRSTDKPFREGFFYWIFDKGPAAIGRKRTQQRGGRRY